MASNYKSYNGNPLIKRSHQDIQWTKKLLTEYSKCEDDPIYFIENYMKIISVEKGLINFLLYDYQKEMVLALKDNRFNIFTTARQVGKSTVTCGFILWYMLFNPDKTIAILANKGDTAREILGKIQTAYEHLPKWMQQGVTEFNKGSFSLENNSRIIAAATSSDNIRGYSINYIFIDEAAFIENWDKFFTSVLPTITSGSDTKVTLVSTPNGMNHYYAIWIHALEGRNQYKPISVDWRKVPGRNDAWKEDYLALNNFDSQKFEQEMEVQFYGSSSTLISGWRLKELVYQIPLIQNDNMIQYKTPGNGRNYAIVCDVARGKGLDYSAFQVIDISSMPYEQVCTYRDNLVTPIDYTSIIFKAATLYNHAMVLVETNDIGDQISSSLQFDFEYDHLLYTESAGRSGRKVTSGFGGAKRERGIRTTRYVKNMGCNMLKLLVENRQLTIVDFDTINELSTFSLKNGSYCAEDGHHDDLVMGLVLFAWLSDQSYFKEHTDINTLGNLRHRTEDEITADLLPFGFRETGGPEILRPVIDLTDPEHEDSWRDFMNF